MAVPSVAAAPSDATTSHYVSVLMCSGPSSGMVYAYQEQDLVYRSKTISMGTHVLVKQHDGGKRLKGVVVHLNPLINARVPPPPPPLPNAVPLATPPRHQPSKRPHEPDQPSQADVVIAQAAKRVRPDFSHPDPEVLRRHGLYTSTPSVSARYPGRRRVRRELTYVKSSLMLHGSSVSVEELDGTVPLSSLGDVVTMDELCAFVEAELKAPVNAARQTSVHASPQPASPFNFRPVRPAPYSRRLIAKETSFREMTNSDVAFRIC